MRIYDHLFNCVAYLFPDDDAAHRAARAGGTGFLIDKHIPGTSETRRFLVTNLHVGATGNTTVRVNMPSSAPLVCTLPAEVWHYPLGPDDLAIADLSSIEDLRPIKSFLNWDKLVPTPKLFEALNVGVGDEVYMVGRFIPHANRNTIAPIARFGRISLMDRHGKVVNNQGDEVDAFLVEMTSTGGASGSPVFVHVPLGETAPWERGRRQRLAHHTFILGVNTGHKEVVSSVLRRGMSDPELTVAENAGVSIVTPYYKVASLLSEALAR